MFKNRSKALFVCALLALIYTIYLIYYFGTAMGDLNSGAELGGAIATMLVTPHIMMVGIGAIFSWISFLSRKPWAALVGAILYCTGALVFIMYSVFCIPLIVLGFIGYSNQKKILKENI